MGQIVRVQRTLVALFVALVLWGCLPHIVFAAVAVSTPMRGGDLYGSAVAADGSRLPGVTVTVERSGVNRTTVTGANGNYRFLNLPPGNYNVKLELEGFKTINRVGFKVPLGRPVTLNSYMPLDYVEEALVVKGSGRAKAARGGRDSGLESIPTVSRNIADYLNLTPGINVQQDRTSSAQKIDEVLDPLDKGNRGLVDGLKKDLKAAVGKDAKLAVLNRARSDLAGLRKGAAEFGYSGLLSADQFDQAEAAIKKLTNYFKSPAYDASLDLPAGTSYINLRGDFGGVDTSLYGLNAYDTNPLLSLTLSEVAVDTGGVSAEYGRFSGGVVNVITKSRGNDLSGSLRINYDNDDWFQTPRAESDKYGDSPRRADADHFRAADTLGGPIWKDRAWFFASYRTASEQNNPVRINNQTSNNSYSIEAAGQSTTLEPGFSTSFNPNPDYFTGFYSAALDGVPATTAAGGQTYENYFYPGSERNSFFSGYGGTTLVNPDFVEPSLLNNWNIPALSGPTAAQRGSLEYLFATSSGDHALKFGFDSGAVVEEKSYTGILSSRNFQLLQGSYLSEPAWEFKHLDGGSQYPGASYSDSRPAITGTGETAINSGSSHYVNDRWQLNDKWSFNIGVRYDEEAEQGTNSASSAGFEWESITPRLGASYDVRGDGKYRFDTTYAQYAGRYAESQLQSGQSGTAGNAWDGTFDFDAGSRGVIIPGGGGNYRSYLGGTRLRFNTYDQFVFNRGPITTRSFFGHGSQGYGFFNNTVNVNFEYTGSCDELLTEADLEELIEDYKDYLEFEYDEYYPVGPGTCGGRLQLKTYQEEFAFLMRTDPEFRDFFDDWDLGLLPPKLGIKLKLIERLVVFNPTAPSRDAGVLPDDAFYQSSGSAEKKVDDQWGLKRIGFKPAGRDGRGAIWPKQGSPTIVAVVDSGIDLTHPELQGQLWANFAEIPNNGKDDDKNGLVDDVFGWNFEAFDNDVFDMYGHGTFIAGIIAAATDNGIGIAGINPWARIMPVKVSTYHGRSNNIRVAQGIYYAAQMGARVINVSFEGDVVSKVIQSAVDHAVAKGALVVVAAGNRGIDVAGVSPAVMKGALTVASIAPDGSYEKYSNHGAAVDIAAPGTHIISLRASRTDLMQFEDPDYKPGSNILGEADILYHLSGTSFAAPHVAGVASLLFSMNPDLTAEQVKRMILQSARDTGTVGTDRLTGYGELDAAAALKADPDYYVDALIDGVAVVGAALRVNGTAAANRLQSAWIELGEGDNPDSWKTVGKKVNKSIAGGALTDIDVNELRGSTTWTLQLVVEHKDGTRRRSRYRLDLG